ncbi:MAG: caspase family protein, partial [Planctomycetota bacterium]
MKPLLAFALSLLGIGIGRAAETPRWSPENTFVLIVGVLDWQQQSLTTYPKSARQDVAFKNQLVARGVPPENISMVLDRDATLAAIQQSLTTIANRSTDDSTLIVYYAGHGMLDEGQGVFANFDIDTRRASETGWTHRSMARNISGHFRGKRVLLFADCCFSGALADVVDRLNEDGFRSACLTSASSKDLSTNNWTFT